MQLASRPGIQYHAKQFVDVTQPGLPQGLAITGLSATVDGTRIAFTQALEPNAHINMQTHTLPLTDPRIAGAALLLQQRLDALGPHGPKEPKNREDSYATIFVGTRPNGQLTAGVGYYPVATASQAVLDAKQAAQALRDLLVANGSLEESNPQG